MMNRCWWGFRKSLLAPALVAGLSLLRMLSPSMGVAGAEPAKEAPLTFETIRMAFSPKTITYADPKDVSVGLKYYADLQIQENGDRFVSEIRIVNSLEEMVQRLEAKTIDMVGVSAQEYLELRERVSLIPSTCPSWDGNPSHYEILLVRKDSGISDPLQLEGKKVAVDHIGIGNIAMIWLETLVMKKGWTGNGDFLKPVAMAENTSGAVLPVFFGKWDGCIVRERAFETMAVLNPQLKSELVVLAKSPPFFRGVVCFRSDFDPAKLEKIERSTLDLHKSAKGRQILMLFKTDGIIRFKPEFLETTIAMLSEHARLKKGWK